MIEKIHIQNFKSIYDLELEVGRINLIIGENGSGKSNFLEALVFVSASESNKLDNEFLVSRGLRVPEPELMRSAFEKNTENIKVGIQYTENTINYEFKTNNTQYAQWKRVNYIPLEPKEEIYRDFVKNIKDIMDEGIEEVKESKQTLLEKIFKKDDKYKDIRDFINPIINNENFQNFIIYSPENTALRVFEENTKIQPLGINGEGLLKLLKVINSYEDKSYINTIIESLQLFNWFEDITIPKDISSLEDKVIIKDKYLYREFTQRSANEGFLFILFYITLIVAKETPKAFAIDNIDASLNPKLCTKLMTILTDLAKKYDKQIFLTTHNPAILDGIDLNDKDEKIFVASRNELGHTQLKVLTEEDNPMDEDGEYLNLSEAFLHGYLGGLPKGF